MPYVLLIKWGVCVSCVIICALIVPTIKYPNEITQIRLKVSNPRNFFGHFDWFHGFGICQLCFVSPLNKVRIFFYYSYNHVDIWKFKWSYTSNTFRKNHCSSQYYSYETLFVLVSFIKNIIHNNTITENTDTIHYSYMY